ncbi:unnamed protein product [Clonostachys rosea]|uniref:Uncharacterized protein n=1 Tax=Bionectria ochroleuca TaxID=29856 RepID=A0ABY6TTS8_BIOOC|nr:unnamed protein product [Clonostachys rosea]
MGHEDMNVRTRSLVLKPSACDGPMITRAQPPREKGRIRQTWWRWRLGTRRRAERAQGEAAQNAESRGEGIHENNVDLPHLDPAMAQCSIVRMPSD